MVSTQVHFVDVCDCVPTPMPTNVVALRFWLTPITNTRTNSTPGLSRAASSSASGRFDDPQAANPPRTRAGSHSNFHIAAESVQPTRKPVDRHAFHAAAKHLRQGRLIGMTE